MYLKEETAKLIGDLKNAVRKWAYGKIDELAADRPKLKAASVYLKRGINNYMEREDKRINSMVDGITLFVADKDGNIDTDMLIDDSVAMFKEMDMNYLTEAHIPYSRLHDMGGLYGGYLYVDIPNIFRDFSADENDPSSYDFPFTDLLIKQMMAA